MTLAKDDVFAASNTTLWKIDQDLKGTYFAKSILLQGGKEEERRRVQLAHYWAHVRGRGVPQAGEVYALP